MKDVIIDIIGAQGFGDQNDVIELSTIGKMQEREGKFLLTYEENETLKPNTIKTTLKADGNNRVTMIRSGAINSKLVIEKGKRNTCFYSIPQGELMLGIFGEEIDNTLNNNGGKVKMSYTIDIDNNLLSKNTVEISVKEV